MDGDPNNAKPSTKTEKEVININDQHGTAIEVSLCCGQKKYMCYCAKVSHGDVVDPKELNAEEEGKQQDDSQKGPKPVSICKLLSKADFLDVILMLIGSTAAIVTGLIMPAYMWAFGDTLDKLNNSATSNFQGTIDDMALLFVYLGAINLVSAGIQSATFTVAGERQSSRLRRAYVAAILRQDKAWFEEHSPAELSTRVNIAVAEVADGLGRKFAECLQYAAQFVGCYVVAFFVEWRLSLMLLATFPVMGLAGWWMSEATTAAEKKGSEQYARAGFIASEVFAGIRTVAALVGEPREVARYGACLRESERVGVAKKVALGAATGATFGCEVLTYALGLWYGMKLVADRVSNGCTEECAFEGGEGCPDNCVSGGDVLVVLFNVLMGSYAMAQATPPSTAVITAKSAAAGIYETLERVPPIDAASDAGVRYHIAQGTLEFRDLTFCYPTRPDNVVADGLSLVVRAGQTVALVGPSGGGKSTLMALALRFYDPAAGAVRVDGKDVRGLNVQHYRAQLGYVRQEPVLFAGTIRENISHGKLGATDDEIIAAAKQANAHNFIKALPDKYKTQVGESGTQLSGGQKQRIAIARALIRDPKILLLDEATSALDRESEQQVQEALDRLQRDGRRTVLVIAHRLSTIFSADKIAVIAKGKVAEQGTHAELLNKGGLYADLYAGPGADDSGKKAIAVEKETKVRTASLSGRKKSTTQASDQGREKDEEAKKADIEQGEKYEKVSMWRVISLMAKDWHWIALGLLGAVLAGGVLPAAGAIMGKNIADFYLYEPDKMREEANRWAIVFVLLGGCTIIGYTTLYSAIGLVGERLTRLLRLRTFTAILRHDIGWFDREENNTGALAASLDADCKRVNTAFGEAWCIQIQVLSTFAVALTLGFIFAWRMALVVLAVVPLNVASMGVLMLTIAGAHRLDRAEDGGPGAVLHAAVTAMDTVAAFGLQRPVENNYVTAVGAGASGRMKSGLGTGLALGFSGGAMMLTMSLTMWYMGIEIRKGRSSFEDAFAAFMALLYAAFGAGQAGSTAGDQKAATLATKRIFHFMDDAENLSIDSFSETGAKPKRGLKGYIEFKGVHFVYPTRPDAVVYGGPGSPTGFNLTAAAGQTVALVGPSGGGKSTAMALLLRFYAPTQGQVLVDGRDVRDYNLRWLRSRIGYVGQEPVLFATSIRNNIAYGSLEESTEEQIIAAAKSANAHDFVLGFQEGYATDVGEKSALLSGGQKQRIAIARAVLGRPAILLLDEATSALDNESEREVQQALDGLQARGGFTTLVIAHRLTTIQGADKIAVVRDGGVVEQGTHDRLLARRGEYYALATGRGDGKPSPDDKTTFGSFFSDLLGSTRS